MRKRLVITFVAITFLVLAGIALGVGSMRGASVHAQTAVVQTHSKAVQAPVSSQQAAPAQETPDPGETSGAAEDKGQDQNLPGGGHQDQGPAVDHQFEGTE